MTGLCPVEAISAKQIPSNYGRLNHFHGGLQDALSIPHIDSCRASSIWQNNNEVSRCHDRLDRVQQLQLMLLPKLLITVPHIAPSEIQNDAKLSETGQSTQSAPGMLPCLEVEYVWGECSIVVEAIHFPVYAKVSNLGQSMW